MKRFIRMHILFAAIALFGVMPVDAFAKVSIPLTVTEPSGIARTGEGMKSGVPVKRGEAASSDDLILVDDSGRAVPAQLETISKWEDGSVRWVLVSFRETVGANGTKRYTLRTRNRGETIPAEKRVTVTDTNDVFTVDTGAVRFDIPIYGGSIISNIAKRDAAGQWTTVSKTGVEAIIWRTGVKKFKSHVEDCKVESAGPERTVILIEGHHMLWDHTVENFDPAELATFKFVARVFCYAGSGEIRLQYTFINDNRDNKIRPSERYHVYAMEELADYKWVNGRWVERPATIKFREKELLDDDYGQINVKDIRLSMTLDDEYTGYRFGVLGGAPSAGSIDGPVALQQVGPVHQYDYFTKDMPFPFTPFKATVLHGMNRVAAEFDKAEGWVTMQGPKGSVFLGGKFFWEYHPKVFALDKNRLEYHVWSSIEDIPAPEIGFAKTHEISLRFDSPDASFDTGGIMAGLNRPLMAAATTDHYMSTGVFGTYLDANEAMWGEAEAYLHESAENAARTRESRNIFGVRNYGDTPGIRYVPIYYNQEYDMLLGSTLQFARTGKRIYFDESDLMAWHFMDVDVLHASNCPLNEGGQHMHFTDHAKGETHAGHCTVEGLWYYYMLTGEPRAREVAVGIADYFAKVAAWKNFLDYRDDEERTIGWALKALVPSWRATLNPRYKLAAQMIVEQAIDGQDPDTGNWDHPLYPNEDKHRPVCVGGKPWMVGIILQGMKHYHTEFKDPRVEKLILNAADWMIWSQYVYMTCSDRQPGEPGPTHLDGLSYAWELSGKRYYLDEALRGFSLSIGSWSTRKADNWTVRGNSVEGMMNMMRIIEEQGTKVWKEGKPVYDSKSAKTVADIQANPKYIAKPIKRY